MPFPKSCASGCKPRPQLYGAKLGACPRSADGRFAGTGQADCHVLPALDQPGRNRQLSDLSPDTKPRPVELPCCCRAVAVRRGRTARARRSYRHRSGRNIERRSGRRIGACSIYRHPARSSHGHFVKASGLRCLSFMVLTPVQWTRLIKALPDLTLLAPSERSNRKHGCRHKLLPDRARQARKQDLQNAKSDGLLRCAGHR